MSGGAFDYIQYKLDDVVNTIKETIELATCERPAKIRERALSVWTLHSSSSKSFRNTPFENIENALYFYKAEGYNIEKDETDDTERRVILLTKSGSDSIELVEFWYEYYPNHAYYPEYSEKTINTFKEAIDIITKAAIYMQRIDWLISGDDGEDDFHERLKEDLEKNETS